MRDEQVLALIKKECSYVDNLSMLRTQQLKIRIASIEEAMKDKMLVFKSIMAPEKFWGKVDEIYKKKVQDFNEELKQNLSREKLKI